MTNIQVKDGLGKNIYLKATGTGTLADPYITEQRVTITNEPFPLATETTVDSIKTLNEVSLGQKGHTFVDTTSPQTGLWVAIQILELARFSNLTCSDTTSPAVNVNLPIGFVLYGNITAFTLSYGKVIAYKG
ncbi:hypothetical protein Nos7524_3223 [Nostoc sp. PCC 7524]|uniref:hypothetical protein n=1 Tax=Nostoc sp. (strain ATCC 29411 / PCC 7524) TaxID=28072 RepID=UPI00029F0D16|nr:hypothetical protein [Nostoc sp. PCC 7524]AFY49023.1 hypothetical protein Nos7524_3223 [Nostoc sp. PCC 7524]